ncbi:hypothetical protein SAMN02745121_02071 [Nannocystis exedens]|uniref:Uncharacterized protein n=1 Tax=Nannocystis exedens TaxID=54 RepID=A0A1I1W0F5_9BACT|nr:hypothetical protein [Nannocystis exedens]PCC72953.1 hypothetical protein NAEX_06039 [Nannocystis exedens]SFD87848.1 hypothetical protein SAMN02745121_02071 [Nannocystis exedens]
MNEGTKALRPVRMWDAWGTALARCGRDLPALLADASPRITSPRPPTRVRLLLRRGGQHGQVSLELRVDFVGVPRAEVDFDGTVYRENTIIEGKSTSEWSSVEFGRKHVELHVIHEAVPKLMDAVYDRSTFMPKLPALADIARIVALQTAFDMELGAAQRIHFELRYGQDEREAFSRMGFELTYANGVPFTDADEARLEARQGPNYSWPSGVAWRREGAMISGSTASFGANAAKIFR